MAHQDTHVEASLLYADSTAPIDAVDIVALQSMLEKLGHPVADVRVAAGEYIHLICARVQILMAVLDEPFPMEHFRGVTSGSQDPGRQDEMLTLLAAHGASLNVLVLNRSGASNPLDLETKTRLCRETVDLLLAATAPELVYWSREDQLVTATEVLAMMEARLDTDFDPADEADENIFLECYDGVAGEPATLLPPPGSDAAEATDSYLAADSFVLRPKDPSLAPSHSDRPAHLYVAPELSEDVRSWFEGERISPRPDQGAVEVATDDRHALRTFLALDRSPEPQQISATALGRASLYLMSAMIAVFSLPVGASILTYNALSGGSFRATSYMMALTGIGLALGGVGLALTGLG